jgi:uncharacterized protein (UPF0335 family)
MIAAILVDGNRRSSRLLVRPVGQRTDGAAGSRIAGGKFDRPDRAPRLRNESPMRSLIGCLPHSLARLDAGTWMADVPGVVLYRGKTMSRPGDIAGDQLRAVVERIENIENEIKELTEAKKEIYLEAKGNGFDVKTLREVIRVRKQDQKERDEQETLLEVYLQAIKGASSTAKAAAKPAAKAA